MEKMKVLMRSFYFLLVLILAFATVGPSYIVLAESTDLSNNQYSDEYWKEALLEKPVEESVISVKDEIWDYAKGDYTENYFIDPYLSESPDSQQVVYDSVDNNLDTITTINQSYYAIQALPFLIPALTPIVIRVGGKLVVKQFLKSSTKQITIRNGHLAGKVHPITRVKFNSKGFPVFNSPFTAPRMPMEMIKNSNSSHFSYANSKLRSTVASNSTIRNKFTSAQLTDIRNGVTPRGYTWHHHENTGILKLVNSTTHRFTGHTGGRAIWGTN